MWLIVWIGVGIMKTYQPRHQKQWASVDRRLLCIERALLFIIRQGDTIMADMTHMNQAVADLQAEVGDIGTKMDALFKAWQDAVAGGDQAAIDAAAQAIEDQVAALKAVADRDTPAPAP